jgi:hypothetical protein
LRTTVTIEKAILDELVKETGARTKAEAVKIAIFDFMRRRKIAKITAMRGKMSFGGAAASAKSSTE